MIKFFHAEMFYRRFHLWYFYQGWGLLSRFPPFLYFSNFSTSLKYMLAIEYHVHIWQVSPQLTCRDTCQIWMTFKDATLRCWKFCSFMWRQNGGECVSNHQSHDCLLSRLFGADQRKHQSSASLAFVRGIHWRPVNSPHKWPVTRKMFPFDDVIMLWGNWRTEL